MSKNDRTSILLSFYSAKLPASPDDGGDFKHDAEVTCGNFARMEMGAQRMEVWASAVLRVLGWSVATAAICVWSGLDNAVLMIYSASPRRRHGSPDLQSGSGAEPASPGLPDHPPSTPATTPAPYSTRRTRRSGRRCRRTRRGRCRWSGRPLRR